MDTAFQELLEDFHLEARERLDSVEELLLSLASQDESARRESMDQARRELHTLKGNSGMMGFSELQELAHGMEDRIDELDTVTPEVAELLQGVDRFRQLLRQEVGSQLVPGEEGGGDEAASAPGIGRGAESGQLEASQELASGSVRVPFTELDGLVELLAEVLLYRNRLSDSLDRLHGTLPSLSKEMADAWDDVGDVRLSFEKVLDFLQDRVLQLRMVPLQTLFRHLNRIVHDESAREGKRVRLDTQGGETPLDKALLELASEALGHLVRNAVNHGIEAPAEREKTGKPEQGAIRLSASVHGQEVHIEVRDDGGGIDPEALRKSARERGLNVGDETSAAQLYQLLFLAGFSTKEGGIDLSAGRGIGLSAVSEAVRRHGGRVEVDSDLGEGTRFLLRLPLSVSITRALFLRADGEEYALPLGAVIESLHYRRDGSSRVRQTEIFEWRGHLLPVLDVGVCFGTAEASRGRGFVVVIEALGRYRALVVDELTGIRDIVVKGLDPLLGSPRGISGSNIMGDGRVVLILDPPALTEISIDRGAAAESSA